MWVAAVGREIKGVYLGQRAATHGKIAIVADFQQRDTKAPLVSSVAVGCTAVNTLRGNPWDTLKTLCGAGQG